MSTEPFDALRSEAGPRRSATLVGASVLGLVCLHAAALAGPGGKIAPASKVDFNRDVRPILAANCFSCHGADAGSRQANLRLDTRDGATAARRGSRAVEPGKPEKSSLVARINESRTALLMPPAGSGHKLTPEQKRTLALWVEQGAPYATHWAFTPVRRPALPGGGAVHPVDAFVRARLKQAGLKPAPEADRPTLIRRVSLDLTGLPPTPEEVRQFVEDRSPDAYEKVVDRLLASPRYGEHWARIWLDLARYADTQGYEKDGPRTIWRYRDWVIDAYNRDLPYDRFTVEQIAGDLLPNPGPSQLLATAFHRNTMTNTEGGVDREEFRTAAVKDRVDTTAQVWMGLTMGCAKCHTHKYDPITHEEYYRFYALFNQTEDVNRGDEAPTLPMPTEEQRTRLAALDERLKGLREQYRKPRPELERAQAAWEEKLAASRFWTPLKYEHASAASGATFTPRKDGAVVVSGKKETKDTYTLTFPLPEGEVRSLRLEALKDSSLPEGGPGRHAADQNVVTSEVIVELARPGEAERTPVPLTAARADFEQSGWPAAAAIDGKPETGWAFSPQTKQPHVAVFDLKSPLRSPGAHLVVTLRQEYADLQLGCFRISTSGAEPNLLKAELRPVSDLAALPRAQRSAAEQRQLDDAFRQLHEPTASLYRDLTVVEKERAALDREIPRIPVMRDLPKEQQRVTRIHQRGNFLDPGKEVTGALPASFMPPAGAPANRLGAAQWLVSPENPLTSRVAVNRVWARLFGTGLVETEEDFGTQGSLPSHPELLDWLASWFMEPGTASKQYGRMGAREYGSGRTDPHTPTRPHSHTAPPGASWSQKQLLRLIVTSATYRQSGVVTGEKQKADPRNVLLSRGPRFRLPAEVIRDQALAVSGLLSAKMHGPSVMPPQPEGLWKTVYSGLKWQTSPGEDRFRRALYTFWRRSNPYPSLTTFDAGSGEFCVIRRVRTNTPLQALVTLNDPAFVEAAGALGKAMLTAPAPSLRERLAHGVRRVLGREPAPAELNRLTTLYANALNDFHAKPGAAGALLKAANQEPLRERGPAEQAAYVVVSNVLLNLDETLTKP